MFKNMITVTTKINSPIEKVWDYWTNPIHIVNWNNASDDWHTPKAENDLKVNGTFRYTMAAKDGSFSFDFWGVYTHIEKFKNIEFTLGDERKVKISFTKNESDVLITESFDAESTNSEELQRNGWQAILNNFKKYVEKN